MSRFDVNTVELSALELTSFNAAAVVESLSLRNDTRYMAQALRTSAPLLLADILSVSIAAALVFAPANWLALEFAPTLGILAAPLVLSFIVAALCTGLYPGVGLTAVAEIRLAAIASTLWAIVFVLALVVHDDRDWANELLVVGMWPALMAMTPVLRRLTRHLMSRYRWWSQPAIVFGGDDGVSLLQSLREHPELGLRPLGVVNAGLPSWFKSSPDPTLRTDRPADDMSAVIEREGIPWGVVLDSAYESGQLPGIGDFGLVPHLLVVEQQHFVGTPEALTDCLGCFHARRVDHRLLLPLPRIAKRAVDIVVSALLLVLLSPLLLALALGVWCTSPGPIFFNQQRVAYGGSRFRMWKFRSMVQNAEDLLASYLRTHPQQRAEWNRTHKLRYDPRMTWLGRILRKTSLDELPQLWNVLVGDMSMVGPRPYPLYEEDDMRCSASAIMCVRPGITGLWQIGGRSRIGFVERLKIDELYVNHWSPWLDLYILWRTVKVVICCEGSH